MENRQNKKREAAPKQAAKRNPSKANQIAQTGFYFLLYLTQRHPILLWTSSFLGMVLLSWLAIAGLTYTNPAPLDVAESPQPEAVSESPQPERQFQQPRQSGSSIGLLAAVAVSCAGVSVFLGRQLRPVKPAPKRAIKRDAELSSSATVRVKGSTQRSTQRSSSPATSANRAPKPVAQASRIPVAAAQSVAKPTSRPAPQAIPAQSNVTVIPAELNHPLDWEDENLAEVMDIRKRPVSFEL